MDSCGREDLRSSPRAMSYWLPFMFSLSKVPSSYDGECSLRSVRWLRTCTGESQRTELQALQLCGFSMKN